MSVTETLPKYSIGVGDRFARQARAQLEACDMARKAGVAVAPVWNKSNREHIIIGSEPAATRAAADEAVREFGWTTPYFVDVDHINLATFERFIEPCDFFTIDVADEIGKAAPREAIAAFMDCHPELLGDLQIPGIHRSLQMSRSFLERTAQQFLAAVQHAGVIYRALVSGKRTERFVTEISMDETERPQTPLELLVILVAIADQQIPIQTIAPKFTGRFNKGVDYIGDVAQFAREFRDDLATIAFVVDQYQLPGNLKLSVHSGSDKFSLYPVIHSALRELDAGVHVKTAGTTWLEELIGLAEASGDGLLLVKDIYAEAHGHREELCRPYATVIDINTAHLPDPGEVNHWSSAEFVDALRHDQTNAAYSPDLRQLLHVGFKVAAKLGNRYTRALEEHREIIARNVTQNLYERHIRPIFVG